MHGKQETQRNGYDKILVSLQISPNHQSSGKWMLCAADKIQYMIIKKKILQKAQTSFHVARWSMPATNSFNKLLWPQDGLISLQLHQPRRSNEIKPINDNFRRNIITINVNAYDKFPLLSSTSSWVLGHLEKKKAWYDKKYQLNSGSVGSPYKTDPMCISSHDPAKNITEVKRLKVLLCMRWKYWTFSKAQGYKAQIHDQVQKTLKRLK